MFRTGFLNARSLSMAVSKIAEAVFLSLLTMDWERSVFSLKNFCIMMGVMAPMGCLPKAAFKWSMQRR